MELKTVVHKLSPMLKNKFFLAFVVFLIWITIFDENNLIERSQFMREAKQLEKDKTYFRQQIEKDTERLQELKTSNRNLEKFAREQYLMHRENEDVFVIVQE